MHTKKGLACRPTLLRDTYGFGSSRYAIPDPEVRRSKTVNEQNSWNG